MPIARVLRRINAWQEQLSRRGIARISLEFPDTACEAYHHFNADRPDAARNYRPELIRRAVEFGYLHWPAKVVEYTPGRHVLDLGCGLGLHGIGFTVAGAASYTGVDPLFKPNARDVKHHDLGRRVPFGWTPAQIMRLMPRIQLVRGTLDELPPDARYDLASLHNVTEHLLDIHEEFEAVARRLTPGGIIIFNHHNFYSWNGHHQKPKTIDQIDRDDPDQKPLIDWGHLTFDPPENHYIRRGLNRIRLDELRSLTERYFTIEQWTETKTDRQRGLKRLTKDIRHRHPDFDERDLLTQNVFCVARRRDDVDDTRRPDDGSPAAANHDTHAPDIVTHPQHRTGTPSAETS